MEEKKIVGLDGTVYMQDPDGQGWRPMPLSPDEIAVQNLKDAAANLRAALCETFQPVIEQAAKMLDALAGAFTSWIANNVFIIAYCWAMRARPEWVRILNRTKKGRTRKKYQDKILRAYLESKEGKT